jgi:hypothetical protein
VDALRSDTTAKLDVARVTLSVATASTAKPVVETPSALYMPQPDESAYVVGADAGPSTRTAANPSGQEELTISMAPDDVSMVSSPAEDAMNVVADAPVVSAADPNHVSASVCAGLRETVPRQEMVAIVCPYVPPPVGVVKPASASYAGRDTYCPSAVTVNRPAAPGTPGSVARFPAPV